MMPTYRPRSARTPKTCEGGILALGIVITLFDFKTMLSSRFFLPVVLFHGPAVGDVRMHVLPPKACISEF